MVAPDGGAPLNLRGEYLPAPPSVRTGAGRKHFTNNFTYNYFILLWKKRSLHDVIFPLTNPSNDIS
jgi:hypothetical protein